MNRYPIGMPRWAPGAAAKLEKLLQKHHNVWEWGGGASSVWLADRVHSLKVIETNPEWAEMVFDATKDKDCNVEVFLIDFDDPQYLKVPEFTLGSPDVWIVDGFRRIDCLAQLLRFATDDCIVVLDDALDYAEHLLGRRRIERFKMPHPYAGTPINQKWHKKGRNTVRTHHPETKETWIWRV